MNTVTRRTEENEPILRLRTDAVEWREIEREIIALDRQAATYLAGNSTATLLWRALDVGATRRDLISTLTETFGIDATRAAADVDGFLEELRSRNLVTD
jgi:coenzyme PQQ synthesis protein D (PqqD)